MPKHNWTKDTMGKCAQVFMEQIGNATALANPEESLVEIVKLVCQYQKIEQDVASSESKCLTVKEFEIIYKKWFLHAAPKPSLGQFFCSETGIVDTKIEECIPTSVTYDLICERWIIDSPEYKGLLE